MMDDDDTNVAKTQNWWMRNSPTDCWSFETLRKNQEV